MIAIIVVALGVFGICSWLTAALLMPALYLADTGLLWVLYLAIMNLKERRDAGSIHPDAVPLAEVALAVGLAVDLLYNWTWAILVFLDLPREPLVTSRLERYKYGTDAKGFIFEHDEHGTLRIRYGVIGHYESATGWRYDRTEWYAAVMLDPFDPSGQHVKP